MKILLNKSEVTIKNRLKEEIVHTCQLCNMDIAISESTPFNIDSEFKHERADNNCNEFGYSKIIEDTSSKIYLNYNRSSFDINVIEENYITCAFCSYKTEYKSNLVRHEKTHEKFPNSNTLLRALFKCEKCPFESEQNSSLQRHLKVHSDVYYRCTHCDFVTKYKESLPRHLLRHKSSTECRMYVCDECEYETKDKISLKRHMLTHRRLEEVEHFKCTYCNFVTKHQVSYNNHMLKIHNKDKSEKHKCPECDFSTYHKISLKSHILTHRKPGEVPMYKCPECPYETKNKQFLPNHMKRHLDNVPCPKCQKLICQRGMPIHLQSHETGDAKKKYKCKQCDYGTLYYGNLSRHMKIMHSNKDAINYKLCPECPFKTFENARLKRHIKEIHSTEAPQFKCDRCEFTSKFNSCLKRHVETAHINTDPVMCPVCNKQSANVYSLRIHMKLHKSEADIKMFECAECPYKTRHSGAYKDHVIRHKSPEEITQYKCRNCAFNSINKKVMTDHITKYSDTSKPENRIGCPSCCFRTSQKGNLRIHMVKMHKGDIDSDEFWYCTYCDFQTLNKKVLKEHLKVHNKNAENVTEQKPADDIRSNRDNLRAINNIESTRSKIKEESEKYEDLDSTALNDTESISEFEGNYVNISS